MKVLFVYSANDKPLGIGTVVKMQAEAIKERKVSVSYFPFLGKGVLGYLISSRKLRKHLKSNHYDIIHAHYSLSGIAATLAFPKAPLMVSLMGSDVMMKGLWRTLIRLLSKFNWAETIVKSEEMKKKLNLSNCCIIPNGVDLSLFEEKELNTAKNKVGFTSDHWNVVFISNPDRKEKNYPLASMAVTRAKDIKPIKLHVIYNKPHPEIITTLFAADVLILTSLWEGSPNIIKEAMAANCPIVATDVGDIRWLLGNEKGHFITEPTIESVSENLEQAFRYVKEKGRTNAKDRLIKLKLDNESISNRIICLYIKHAKGK